MRIALGLSYRGSAYNGWQCQPSGNTVQDHLELALAHFLDEPVRVVGAGRTDTGVHALQQVVHLDTDVERTPSSWVRGSNRFLPQDISIQWAQVVGEAFHARYSALGRRYVYWLLESPVRPGLEHGFVGWTFRPLDESAMRAGAALLVGEHDFSALRSSQCQSASPVRTVRAIDIARRGAYWRFDFDANAFLHHMVRNIMGCLLAIGNGSRTTAWFEEVLASKSRAQAAPTFAPDGLYFAGPYYDRAHAIPSSAPLIADGLR